MQPFFSGFGLDLNLTINSDMDTIIRAMAEPDSGLDIRDRIWLKMPIPRSFLGTDSLFGIDLIVF